jgi:phosphate-selective porin
LAVVDDVTFPDSERGVARTTARGGFRALIPAALAKNVIRNITVTIRSQTAHTDLRIVSLAVGFGYHNSGKSIMTTETFRARLCLCAMLIVAVPTSHAADKALLDILLKNGVITQSQYSDLIAKDQITAQDVVPQQPSASADGPVGPASPGGRVADVTDDETMEEYVDSAVADAVAEKIESAFPVKASHGSKGFRLETRDGKFQTNLQWRAQMRFTNPYVGDPRQVDDFSASGSSNFELRRLRTKIGGFGYRPWLKYYFELDLQPSRDPDDAATTSSTRVIDYRIDLAKWEALGMRVGQWKIDFNRERVDSSGRQQFVERSIINRIFTIDRQIGVQLRGRLFNSTPADLRYYAGVFNGEGRGVRNSNGDEMYVGRLQWNFLGRDLDLRQTDVEYTELPTASLAIGGMVNKGPCTRWSSSGCGSLDGFESPITAEDDQFRVKQWVQEFAFKYRGFSIQQEYHDKSITDRVLQTENQFDGAYFQTGYFFGYMFDFIPKPLEFAARYAALKEPNETDRGVDNDREEYTLAANWFFNGHNNKLTLDYSYLTLDDNFLNQDESDSRVRFQWDVSF